MSTNNRYQHRTDITAGSDPQAYKQGQEQARVSLERYHYLCAAATKKFSIPGRPGQGLPFYRDELDFSAYTAYPLENIPGVQIHVPSRDGTVHPRDIDPYVGLFRRSWKCRQDDHEDHPRVQETVQVKTTMKKGATMIGGGAVYGEDLDKYLRTKVVRMGHMLPLIGGDDEEGL